MSNWLILFAKHAFIHVPHLQNKTLVHLWYALWNKWKKSFEWKTNGIHFEDQSEGDAIAFSDLLFQNNKYNIKLNHI